jgi:hypothetical protein
MTLMCIRRNAFLDNKLAEGYELYKYGRRGASGRRPDWKKIAKHVRHSFKGGKGIWLVSNQCRQRWVNGLNPELEQLRGGNIPWTLEEDEQLKALVQEHRREDDKVDWKTIQDKLGRPSQICQNRQKALRFHSLKKGSFTEEEDSLILSTIANWPKENKKKGVWVAVGQTLGRSENNCRLRWVNTLAKKHPDLAASLGLLVTPAGSGRAAAAEARVIAEEMKQREPPIDLLPPLPVPTAPTPTDAEGVLLPAEALNMAATDEG